MRTVEHFDETAHVSSSNLVVEVDDHPTVRDGVLLATVGPHYGNGIADPFYSNLIDSDLSTVSRSLNVPRADSTS